MSRNAVKKDAPNTPKKQGEDIIECSVDGCTNQAAGGGICRKHGGKRIHKTTCSRTDAPNIPRKVDCAKAAMMWRL